MPEAPAEFIPGQKVRLLVDCGKLRKGETLIVFNDGEKNWASRDGTKKTPYCSGDHIPDHVDPFKTELPPVWETITDTEREKDGHA